MAAVAVEGGPAQWIHGSPSQQNVKVTVTNAGTMDSGPYRINYQWIAGSTVTWLNGNEQGSFDVHSPGLPDGASATHTIPWTLQPAQTGAGAIRVTVSGGGDSGSAGNQKPLALFVPVQNVSLGTANVEQTIHADEVRFMRVNASNLGNVLQEILVEPPEIVAGPTDRLQAELSQTAFFIEPGRNITLTLFATYPFEGDTSPFAVTYELSMETKYGRTVTIVLPTIHGDPGPRPAPSAFTFNRVGSGDVTAPPGASVNVPFRLTHDGSDADVFIVEASAGTDWQVRPAFERVGLLPHEVHEFNVTLTFPEFAPLGTRDVAKATARSHRDLPVTEIPLNLRVDGPIVVVEADEAWPPTYYVDDQATIPLRATNLGNQPTPSDGRIVVRASATTGEPTEASAALPVIPPGAEALVTVALDAFAQPGPLQLAIIVESPTEAVATKGFVADLLIHDADIEIQPPLGLSGAPGEIVAYRSAGQMFRVKNNGNAPETVLIIPTAKGNAILPSGFEELLILPGDTRSVPLDHELPLPAGPSPRARLNLTAAIRDRPTINWTSFVETDVLDQVPPTIDDPNLYPKAARGEAVRLSLHVTDDTQVTRVTATVVAPSGARRPLTFTSDGPDIWTALFTPTELGNHSIEVTARDRVGRTTNRTLYTHAETIAPPVVTLRGPRDGATVFANDTYLVEAHDALGIASITLTFMDAGRNTIRATALEHVGGNASFNLTDLPSGVIGIKISATNPAGARTTITQTAVLAHALQTPAATPLAEPEREAATSRDAPGLSFAVALAILAMFSLLFDRRRA